VNRVVLFAIIGINVTAKKRKAVANAEKDRTESIISLKDSNLVEVIEIMLRGNFQYIIIKKGISKDMSLFRFQNTIITSPPPFINTN